MLPARFADNFSSGLSFGVRQPFELLAQIRFHGDLNYFDQRTPIALGKNLHNEV